VQKKEIEIGEIGIVQKRALLSSFIGWMFDGFETSTLILVGSAAMLSLLPDPDPDPDQIRFAVGTALGGTLMGWALGGTVGSIMADYVGRKKMLMISIVGYCALTAFTALSQSVMMLIALRFLTGMFLGTEWSTGTALVAETWPASARAKALGFMQSGYGFGFFLAAGLWLLFNPTRGPKDGA
jgi:MFS family permease